MILAFLLMLVIVAAMSIGVVMGRKPIAGSCGGMSALGVNGECQVCGGKPQSCRSDDKGLNAVGDAREQARALATDAAAGERRGARTL